MYSDQRTCFAYIARTSIFLASLVILSIAIPHTSIPLVCPAFCARHPPFEKIMTIIEHGTKLEYALGTSRSSLQTEQPLLLVAGPMF
jgi:hypothetical protein